MLKPVQLPGQFGFYCVKLQVPIKLRVKLCKIPVNVFKIQLFKTHPASNPFIRYQAGSWDRQILAHLQFKVESSNYNLLCVTNFRTSDFRKDFYHDLFIDDYLIIRAAESILTHFQPDKVSILGLFTAVFLESIQTLDFRLSFKLQYYLL